MAAENETEQLKRQVDKLIHEVTRLAKHVAILEARDRHLQSRVNQLNHTVTVLTRKERS